MACCFELILEGREYFLLSTNWRLNEDNQNPKLRMMASDPAVKRVRLCIPGHSVCNLFVHSEVFVVVALHGFSESDCDTLYGVFEWSLNPIRNL